MQRRGEAEKEREGRGQRGSLTLHSFYAHIPSAFLKDGVCAIGYCLVCLCFYSKNCSHPTRTHTHTHSHMFSLCVCLCLFRSHLSITGNECVQREREGGKRLLCCER